MHERRSLRSNRTAGGLSGRHVALATMMFLGAFIMIAHGAMAGEVLYQSNFSQIPDGQVPDGFRVVAGNWAVQGDKLIGQSAAWVNGQIMFGDPSWTDYEIEAKITFLSAAEPTRWAALMYRGPAQGAIPYHLYTIRQNAAASNGIELAYRTPGDQWDVRVTKSWESALELGRAYSIRAVIHGNNAMYFFEGEPIIEMDDILSQPSGTVGFVTNGTQIAIEELVVRSLTQEDIDNLPRTAQGVTPDVSSGQGTRAPLVIAHRGASGVMPENTLAAFEKAIEIGVDLIEIDVHRTKDGHVVVIHDGTVDRTAKGDFTGRVADLTLEQIKSLDAGIWKSLRMRGEQVPTLEETLLAGKGKAIYLLENKATGIERDIAEIIRQTGMQQNIVFQSFDAGSVRTFRELMPEVPAGVLFGNPGIEDDTARAATLVSQALSSRASVVAVNYTAVTPEFVRYIQARGLNVWVWTVNQESDMQRMLDAGVDGIITDYPERLNSLLGK